MRKFIGLLMITIFTLTSFVFVEAQAYEEYYSIDGYNTYTISSSSDKKESKITKRKTRAQKRREARRAEFLKQKEMAASKSVNSENEEVSKETKEFYNMNPIIKPLKNNFDGSTRSTKPSKLKSNYYQSQNKSN